MLGLRFIKNQSILQKVKLVVILNVNDNFLTPNKAKLANATCRPNPTNAGPSGKQNTLCTNIFCNRPVHMLFVRRRSKE